MASASFKLLWSKLIKSFAFEIVTENKLWLISKFNRITHSTNAPKVCFLHLINVFSTAWLISHWSKSTLTSLNLTQTFFIRWWFLIGRGGFCKTGGIRKMRFDQMLFAKRAIQQWTSRILLNKSTRPWRWSGQVVSMLAFYSANLSLNPAEVYSFYIVQKI